MNDRKLDDRTPDERDELSESDPYKRRVAVVLAVLGLLGAWIGVLRVDSGNRESYYARETTRAAAESMSANISKGSLDGLETDLDAEADALEGDAGFDPVGLPSDVGEVDRDLASGDAAAGLDAGRRDELRRRLTLRAERDRLRRKALAETRVGYNNRTSQYETVLTTLGVALFLVGFTLVLNRRTRPPVLVPGLILAVYVAGWALWIHAKDIPSTPTAAIDAAAVGATHAAFGEHDKATAAFDRAIAADPDFVAAYNGRSVASFLFTNPDFLETLAVIDANTPEADQAQADAETAVSLSNEQDFTSLFLSGLYRFYDDDFDGSARRMRQALEVNDRAPEAYLSLAAAELARGNTDEAVDQLAAGVKLLGPAEDSAEARQLAADLFTLLEQVDLAVPQHSDGTDEVRALLAAGEARLVFGDLAEPKPEGGSFTLESSNFDQDAAGQGAPDGDDRSTLSIELGYAELPPDSAVSLYVFEQPAHGAAFVQRAELAQFSTVGGSGTLSGSASLQPRCTPVAFRYDVYVNGAPVTSFDAPGGTATC